MRIVGFRLDTIENELKKPFVTNIRRVDTIEDVLLTLITDEGASGYGEAPPTVAITGEDIETINKTIKERIFPAIMGLEMEGDDIFEAVHASTPKNSSAKACVDMAIYDLLAKKSGKPLYEYLGGKKKKLKTNLTISLNDKETMLQDAIEAYNDGFEILKVKVGQNERDSIEVMQSIRSALPRATLRVDANQAWDVKSSLAVIEKIASLGIELVEQPVKADDLAALKEITTHSPIPILADESVFSYDDALRILDGKMADYINIKLMKSGGIYEASKIAKLAKERGAKVMMGSMLESVVSISAAVHFAMSDDNICFYDLDGPLLAKPSSVKNALSFDMDEIALAECIGLGIQI